MPLMNTLKSKAGSLAEKVKETAQEKLLPAKLEKARLQVITDPSAIGAARGETLTVQFNPSEYTLERGMRLARRIPLGRDPNPQQQQAVSGDLSYLSVSLYFDTITDLHSLNLTDVKSLKTKSGVTTLARDLLWRAEEKDPAEACAEIMKLLKFNKETHQPPLVNFVWGPLNFEGMVQSLRAHYTMFDPNGTPVRAKVDLRICGEEKSLVNEGEQLPFESPDRTKERTLAQGDQLWMVASKEYDDPAQWKVIAEANNILNPRKLEKAAVLKVPSIK